MTITANNSIDSYESYDPNEYFYIKGNVSLQEYRMYRYIDSLDLNYVPKYYYYDHSNKKLKIQKINEMNISNMYGESIKKVPKKVIKQIRNLIKELYDIGIVYPDITGYNFIEDKQGKIWIVDFEHCFFIGTYNRSDKNYSNAEREHIDFVEKFINGHNGWNPEFL